MKIVDEIQVLARSILELLEDPKRVRTGLLYQNLQGILVDERGVDEKDFQRAIALLVKAKWALPKDMPPVGPKSVVQPRSVFLLTPKGKAMIREWLATSQFNVRAPHRLLEELGSVAHEGESQTDAALRLMEEGIRMEKYPGIVFRWAASGRRPFVIGTGLSIWEIYHIHRDFKGKEAEIAKAYPYLKPGQINVAIAYAQKYLSEMPVGEWGEKPPFAREFRV